MDHVKARRIRRLSTATARLAILGLLYTIAIIGGASAARGAPHPSKGIGAGVAATPLRLRSDVHPGSSYRFPALYVKNTGDEASTYRVQVQRIGTRPGRPVPAAWVHLSRTQLRLRARESALIPVTLVLPKNAGAGDYRTDLVFGTSTSHLKSGTALGAAAADDLIFTVASPSGFHWPSWLVYLLIGLAAGGLLIIGIRRSGIRVQVERRR